MNMTDNQDPIIKPGIDFEKSIKRGRLAYKMTAGLIFSFVLSYVANFIVLFAMIMPLLNPKIHTPAGLAFFVIFIIIWIILNPFCNNAFVKIDGKNIRENKQDILLVMDEFFGKYTFQINDEKMMRSFKPSYRPIWGRIITILYDGDMMYLNITSLGKSNDPILGLSLWNFIKAKRIAWYYKRNFNS